MFDSQGLTWRCQICGEERPDAQISVYTIDLAFPGIPVGNAQANVTYCNDRPACVAAAPAWAREHYRAWLAAEGEVP